jgi:hypothetical protein
MVEEKMGMRVFDDWVTAFAAHLEQKGPVPGIEDAERSASSTTNQDKTKTG